MRRDGRTLGANAGPGSAGQVPQPGVGALGPAAGEAWQAPGNPADPPGAAEDLGVVRQHGGGAGRAGASEAAQDLRQPGDGAGRARPPGAAQAPASFAGGDGHAVPAGAVEDQREVPRAADRAGPAREAGRADWVPWLIALIVFAAYAPISIFRYLRLDPSSWDLGIFTEYVKQYAHLHAPIVDIRGAGFNLLGDHFHPIVALIAPFFRVFPSPVTLLVAQALLAAVSVVPVSRAAAERLGIAAGRAIGAAYGFSWGLQQMVNYDFHEIAFAVPLLACSLSALVRGRTRAAVWWALPLVFVKEDQGFTVAAIGILITIACKRPRAGLLLAFWGLAWSLLAITVIIPHFSPTHDYLYWSDGGTVSPVGGHISVAGLISQLAAGSATKLPALVLILLPTAFLALRSPLVLVALPSLALRFIGTNSAYWGTDWHYNATVMPIVFIAAIDGMARIRAAAAAGARPAGSAALAGPADTTEPAGPARQPTRLADALQRHGAAVMLAIAAALAFQFPLSELWLPQTYTIDQHVAAARAAMARVPDGATVATDLDLLAPLASRTDTFWLGNSGNPATSYVVFDTASTDWQPPPANVLAFVESLNHGVRYLQIYSDDGVYVFIRAGGPAG